MNSNKQKKSNNSIILYLENTQDNIIFINYLCLKKNTDNLIYYILKDYSNYKSNFFRRKYENSAATYVYNLLICIIYAFVTI